MVSVVSQDDNFLKNLKSDRFDHQSYKYTGNQEQQKTQHTKFS